ncbi:MAG: thiamine diphosphokinase [Mycoplasmataceae bacterium]|nr:thiamine diphosphokinase [Mycoplasmataceae bacterium]
MTNYLIVTENPNAKTWKFFKNSEFHKVIGIDNGAAFLIKKKIELDFIAGDFDNMSNSNRSLIDRYQGNTKYLNPDKDITDLEYVLSKIEDEDCHITAYVKNDRMDHSLNQLLVLHKYQNLKIISDNYEMYSTSKKESFIEEDRYKYFGVFSFTDSKISIDKAKYNVKQFILDKNITSTSSNEWTNNEDATLKVHKGKVIVVKNLKD